MTTLKTLTLTLLLLLCASNAVQASEPLSHITSGGWYEIDSKVMNEKRRYAYTCRLPTVRIKIKDTLFCMF